MTRKAKSQKSRSRWMNLRTTNPVESPFATVKARTKVTKGAGSRKAGLAMAPKLMLAAENHWRRVNAPHLVALVQAGVKFPDGQAQVRQVGAPDAYLSTNTPLGSAASEALIHSI